MKDFTEECVNALNRATAISTRVEHISDYTSAMCVNALNRATAISTKIVK